MTKRPKVKQKHNQKDTRVTAPLISWKAALIIFGMMYFLVVGQSFIVAAFLDEIPVLASILMKCSKVISSRMFPMRSKPLFPLFKVIQRR